MSTTAGNKKLTNQVERCVEDCLTGLVSVNTGLQVLQGHLVVIRSDIEEVKGAGKVALVSGGGSGHEPAHAGYIGQGMLSGAVAGAVFTSPPPSSILAAIKKVGKDNPGGVLLIVKNYTGDRLNFGLAAERAKAEGINVEMLVVGEDTALTSADKSAGRRGLCGTVFIHKIAGALAESGASLSHIVTTCRKAAASMGTIGLSLSPCSVPGSGPSFQLASDEMELGLGIHGEVGVRRLKMTSADEAVTVMLDHLTDANSATHLSIPKGSHVAVMVNNLGGTSVLELNIIAGAVIKQLECRGVSVDQAFCGSFMTSLEMAGVSLTVLLLDDMIKQCLGTTSKSLVRLLGPSTRRIHFMHGQITHYSPTTAPGWSKPLLRPGDTDRKSPGQMSCDQETRVQQLKSGIQVSEDMSLLLKRSVQSACEAVIKCEKELNLLDTKAGDGDCGTTLKRGAQAILERLSELPVSEPSRLMLSLAAVIEEAMGGSSGAFYSLLLSAAARSLSTDVRASGWCTALGDAVQAVQKYGGAEPGDRTMLDSLHAAHTTLVTKLKEKDTLRAFQEAVKAAEEAARQTAQMKARAGRASYVNPSHLTQPDPGAHAVGVWMSAVYQVWQQA